MDLQAAARDKLKSVYRNVAIISERPALWYINSYPTNLRTASRKSGDKFWFDVTPDLYERRQVEFFIYVCGEPELMYVFPRLNFEHLVRTANLGGQKQVPNFTLFADSNEFEPAGQSQSRINVAGYRNAFFLIPGG